MTHLINKKTLLQCDNRKKSKAAMLVASVGLVFGVTAIPEQAQAKRNTAESDLTYIEEFGKRLFFENISSPSRMSCATCHAPNAGGTNGHSQTNLTQVAVTGADPNGENHKGPGGNPNPGVPNAGGLKPPTNKYVQYIDLTGKVHGLMPFEKCERGCPPTGFRGGAFWNGRAKGDSIDLTKMAVFENSRHVGVQSIQGMYEKYLGAVTDQAHASPFINPVEQAIGEGTEGKIATCEHVMKTKWGAELYDYTWGMELSCGESTIDDVFARFAISLGAWQMSYENNPFDSKRDQALANDKDGKFPLDDFTDQENFGHDLFYGTADVGEREEPLLGGQGRCFFCHRSGSRDGTSPDERYTDDAYHNIGTPRNYEIPNRPAADIGLAKTTGQLDNPLHLGGHKTPTLRNLDLRPNEQFVKAYTHNGWFKSVESLIHFYNTAAIKQSCEDLKIMEATEKQALANDCWPRSESTEIGGFSAVDFGLIGDLKLTPEDEAAIVAYLKTLSDTSIVQPPKPYKSQPYDEKRLSRN